MTENIDNADETGDVNQADNTEVDAGSADVKPWYDGADEETIGFIQNKKWDENPLGAIKAYQELEKFRGVPEEQLLKLPKDGEPMDEIWQKLGRPEKPEGYEVELPDDFNVDEARLNGFREKAFEAGIPADAFTKLVQWDAEFQAKELENYQLEQKQKSEAELADLKTEYGDAYEERRELARRFVTANLPKGADKKSVLSSIEDAVGTKLMIEMFSSAGMKFGEDKLPDSTGDRPFGYTKEQALDDRKKLMNDISSDPSRLDLFNRNQGNDLDKIKRLNKIIAGE